MNFDEFNTPPCLVPPPPVGQECAGIDPRCLDLEWAANHPETCPNSSAITGLKVTPEAGQIEVGGTLPFSAALLFANGRSKDVTAAAVWSISDSTIASIDARGLASGMAEGTTTVQATYGTLVDFGQITVVAHCVQAGMDIVLVVDRSTGMAAEDDGGMSRLDLAKRAAQALVGAATFQGGKDQIAVVSCAGVFRSNATPTYQANATLHQILTRVEEDIIGGLASIELGRVYFDIAGGHYGTECASGIGAGLARAREELLAHGRADTRKLIVYVGPGNETHCLPDPAPIAADIASRHWQLAGIALGPPLEFPLCGVTPTTTWAYVESLVTCNLFWGVDDLDDLPNVFAEVIYTLCGKARDGDACVYYMVPTEDPPVSNLPARDKLNYYAWANWKVLAGRVDLIGLEFYQFFPEHGQYMDLCGTYTNLESLKFGHVFDPGVIESRQEFILSPGTYRLSMDLAGNQRSPGPQSLVASVGDLLTKAVQIQDYRQAFRTYAWEFSVSVATPARIKIAHDAMASWQNQSHGILLDNVKLENVTSGAVLLSDTFD